MVKAKNNNRMMIIGTVVILAIIIGIVAFSTISKPEPAIIPTDNNDAPIVDNGLDLKPSANQGKNIVIGGQKYLPQTLTINKGETIVWVNDDSMQHTVTSDSGSELNSGTIGLGQKYSHTFENAGTYEYHCEFHSSMKGKIIVQ
ncbi:MAG: cupredoxin family copper-binding protein [Nanoarchaeota archaeon]